MIGKISIDFLPENSDVDLDIMIKCKLSDYNSSMTIENLKHMIELQMNRIMHEIGSSGEATDG